jgi:hypothetical protein
MQIRDISKPVTSKALNESLAKKFGYKLNLEQFTEAQLEDVRNKLRTEISQLEVSESFDSVNGSQKYQKTRALLDVINQEIMEREMNPKEVITKKKPSKAAIQKQKTDEAKTKQIYFASMRKKAEDHSVPESWINSAINRINVGESDQEELVSELTTRYDLRESVAEHIVYLAEGEETKASVIMATKDMVDQITGWLEDTAQLKAEHLLELMDSIRETLGSDVASKYEQAVKPALESIYTTLETSRQGLSGALALVSGGEAPTMGAPAPAPEEGGLGGEELPPVPDVGGAPALGGEELPPVPGGEAGREKRESVDYSRRLGILLNNSKKK